MAEEKNPYSPRRLTDAIVRKLPLPPSGKVKVLDAPDPERPHLDWCRRFGVRVYASGVKTFFVEYTVKGQEPKYIAIGAYPNEYGVEAARIKAIDIRRAAKQDGEDPQAEKQAERAAPTMEVLADRFVAEWASKKRAPTTEGYTIAADRVKARWGKKKVAAITPEDVEEWHAEITKTAPYMANRVAAAVSKMFSLAMKWRMRTDNPVKGLVRNAEQKRKRYATPDELARLTRALAAHPEQAPANAIRMMVLTGARKGEVLSATWSQFDFHRNVWVKPDHATKQKREHETPLSATMLALLKQMKKAAGSSPYLFPGVGKTGHLDDVRKAWVKVCKKAGITGLRLHDLRHSYASMLVSAGHGLPVIRDLLGHADIQTSARYAHLFDTATRAAANQVGSKLAGMVVTKPKGRKLRAVR
jgi:integrase